ncbi:hypothetical protein TeGR_g8785, partial [Tetraparma gracilis]
MRFAVDSASARSGALFNLWENKSRNTIHDTLDVQLRELPPHIFHHTHVTVASVDLQFLLPVSRPGLPPASLPLLSSPVNLKFLVSDCLVPGLAKQPSQRVAMYSTHIHLNMSPRRARGFVGVSRFATALSTQFSPPPPPSPPPSQPPLLPRIKTLTSYALMQTRVDVHSFSLNVLVDEPSISVPQRRILLEETAFEFLSQISTYVFLPTPSQHNPCLSASRQMFVDRICSLGIPLKNAQHHLSVTEATFKNKLEYFHNANHSYEDDDLEEGDADGGPPASPPLNAKPNARGRRVSVFHHQLLTRRDSDKNIETRASSDEHQPELAESFSDNSDGNEESDDDSVDSSQSTSTSNSNTSSSTSSSSDSGQSHNSQASEHAKLIEDAMDATLEETLESLKQTLNDVTFPESRVVLAVELIDMRATHLQLVYDERSTLTLKTLNIHNGNGTYFMRIIPGTASSTAAYDRYVQENEEKPETSFSEFSAQSPTSSPKASPRSTPGFLDLPPTPSSPAAANRSPSSTPRSRRKQHPADSVQTPTPKKTTRKDVEDAAFRHSKSQQHQHGLLLALVKQDRKEAFSRGGTDEFCLHSERAAKSAARHRKREYHTTVEIE